MPSLPNRIESVGVGGDFIQELSCEFLGTIFPIAWRLMVGRTLVKLMNVRTYRTIVGCRASNLISVLFPLSSRQFGREGQKRI